MSKYKYQIIKLTRSTPNGLIMHTINDSDNVFPNQSYNNIHSFQFYVNQVPSTNGNQISRLATATNVTEIKEFRISNFEVVGPNTPFKIFAWGTSTIMEERFTEVNIPNNFYKIKLTLSQWNFNSGGFNGEIYLILRLNNIDPKDHFKNFYRYETKVIDGLNNPTGKIKKFMFKNLIAADRLKGMHVSFIDPKFIFVGAVPGTFNAYTGIGVIQNGSVGKISLQINNKRTQPLLLNCQDFAFQTVTRKVDFIELDEPIVKGSVINGYFHQSNLIPNTLAKFSLYLTLKYAIK